MNTLTLSVAARENIRERALAAFGGKAQGAHISFASLELLWKVLTPKRWDILRAMTRSDGLGIREIARRVERDVKAVHADVHALLDARLIERTPEGKMLFPYDAVHVDFTLTHAA